MQYAAWKILETSEREVLDKTRRESQASGGGGEWPGRDSDLARGSCHSAQNGPLAMVSAHTRHTYYFQISMSLSLCFQNGKVHKIREHLA